MYGLDPHFRFALEETSRGTMNLVMNISGAFRTDAEMHAFMREYGQQLIWHADSLEASLHAKMKRRSARVDPVAVAG